MTITTAVSVEERRALARVPLDEPRGVLGRLLAWYARRTYGDVPDNGLALLHHKPVLRALLGVRAPGRQVGPARPGPQDARADRQRRGDRLRADLGVDGFLELTMMVAVENERSRFNSALGLTSQGFADRCELS